MTLIPTPNTTENPAKRSSLQDVLLALETVTDISDNRRRDLRSAVRSAARIMDQAPESVTADWPALRHRLFCLSPAEAGLSNKRFQNIRSDLHAALECTGILHASRQRQPRAKAWEELYQQLPDKRLRNGLTGLIRYCSEREIAPSSVSDQTTRGFCEYLEREGVRDKPRQVYRQVCQLWNEAASTIPDWPDTRLAVPDNRPSPWRLAWAAFHPDFQADVEDYSQWLTGDDLLADRFPPHDCKPDTIRLRKDHIRGLASAVIRSGVPVESLCSLADLVQPDNAKRALEYYLAQYDDKTTTYIRSIAGTLVSIATHWVCLDEDGLNQL